MKTIARILTSLVIQIEFGFTKTGRVAHRTSTITNLRADVTEEEIRDFVEFLSLHLVMAGRITSVKLVRDTIYDVWTPEMRVRKEEESLASMALKRQVQQDTDMGAAASSTANSTVSAAGTAATAATGMPVSAAMPAVQGAILGEEAKAEKSLLGKLHNFFTAPGQEHTGAGSAALEKTAKPEREEAVNPLFLPESKGAESKSDLSYLVKDWDWSKPRPWATKEQEKLSPDFLTRLKANDFKITKAELDALTSWSPHAGGNTTAQKTHLTPFKDLDPMIYGGTSP